MKDQGNKALQEGDIDKAISLYSEGINLDEENYLLWSNRALCYAKKGIMIILKFITSFPCTSSLMSALSHLPFFPLHCPYLFKFICLFIILFFLSPFENFLQKKETDPHRDVEKERKGKKRRETERLGRKKRRRRLTLVGMWKESLDDANKLTFLKPDWPKVCSLFFKNLIFFSPISERGLLFKVLENTPRLSTLYKKASIWLQRMPS